MKKFAPEHGTECGWVLEKTASNIFLCAADTDVENFPAGEEQIGNSPCKEETSPIAWRDVQTGLLVDVSTGVAEVLLSGSNSITAKNDSSVAAMPTNCDDPTLPPTEPQPKTTLEICTHFDSAELQSRNESNIETVTHGCDPWSTATLTHECHGEAEPAEAPWAEAGDTGRLKLDIHDAGAALMPTQPSPKLTRNELVPVFDIHTDHIVPAPIDVQSMTDVQPMTAQSTAECSENHTLEVCASPTSLGVSGEPSTKVSPNKAETLEEMPMSRDREVSFSSHNAGAALTTKSSPTPLRYTVAIAAHDVEPSPHLETDTIAVGAYDIEPSPHLETNTIAVGAHDIEPCPHLETNTIVVGEHVIPPHSPIEEMDINPLATARKQMELAKIALLEKVWSVGNESKDEIDCDLKESQEAEAELLVGYHQNRHSHHGWS